jgi:hypothetical protein
MGTGPLPIPAPGTAPTPGISIAAGSTEAVESDAITPDGDGFTCSLTRAIVRSRAGGIAIVVTAAAVPIAADGDTPTTLKGTLTVVSLPDLVPLSEPLTVCDFSIAPTFEPLAGHVLRLGMPPLDVVADPGQQLALVWNETGDLGLDGITPGVRPEFLVLGWPLQTIESGSF